MKVLRTYEWNDHRYSVVERDDGSTIEIKGDPTMTDAQALAKVPMPPRSPVETAQSISAFSDTELLAEAKSRKLHIILEGTAICQQ